MDKVVHFEIPFEKADRAKKFYKEIFGWGIMDIPEMNYTIVTTVATDKNRMPQESGAINGGMEQRSETLKSPIIVIDVPSIDDYLKKIIDAGGKVVQEKRQVGNMGLYARIADTEGNIIGIWENIPRSTAPLATPQKDFVRG